MNETSYRYQGTCYTATHVERFTDAYLVHLSGEHNAAYLANQNVSEYGLQIEITYPGLETTAVRRYCISTVNGVDVWNIPVDADLAEIARAFEVRIGIGGWIGDKDEDGELRFWDAQQVDFSDYSVRSNVEVSV